MGSVINSAQPQLNIFDIFPSSELTVTAVGESNHLVTLSLSVDCETLSSLSLAVTRSVSVLQRHTSRREHIPDLDLISVMFHDERVDGKCDYT